VLSPAGQDNCLIGTERILMQRPWHVAATAAFGLATAAYGVAVLRDPAALLRPTAIAGGKHDTRKARLLARATGARDVAAGLSLVAAGVSGRPDRLRQALTARAFSDLTAVAWAAAIAPRSRRALIAGAAGTSAGVALLLRHSVAPR
jgi:hypothetical protein